uniref:Uncharacterized protein n=1 Tax=Glossina palpalis gambiensis TaxID=67801 RepID=A0A1B0BJ02_9MUSC
MKRLSANIKVCKFAKRRVCGGLSECYNINDKAIQLITAKLSRLRALHISGCSQLTDHSLHAILVSGIEDRLSELSTLRNLNMDNANSMENAEHFVPFKKTS